MTTNQFRAGLFLVLLCAIAIGATTDKSTTVTSYTLTDTLSTTPAIEVGRMASFTNLSGSSITLTFYILNSDGTWRVATDIIDQMTLTTTGSMAITDDHVYPHQFVKAVSSVDDVEVSVSAGS